MVFSTTKNTKNFLERRHSPFPDPSLVGRGIPPPRRLRHLDPSHSKILATPGYYEYWSICENIYSPTMRDNSK